MTAQMKERVERLAGIAGLTVKEGHLILETSAKALAASMQRFLETAKMIGDVYLVHKNRVDPENILIPEIRHALDNEHLPYVEKERLRGRIEAHSFDLLVLPNGHPGLAIGVVSGSEHPYPRNKLVFQMRRYQAH